MLEGILEVGGVAGAEAEGKFGETEAGTEEGELDLGIVYGGEEVKDEGNFVDACINKVSGEGDDADGGAEKDDTVGRCAGDSVTERMREEGVEVTTPY